MRNFKLFTLLFLMTSILGISACSKDDKDPEVPVVKTNEFKIANTTYALANGFWEDYGDNGNGSYDIDVYLSSSTINLTSTGLSLEGTGDFIYLDFNSSTAGTLAPGTYTYSAVRSALTFVDGDVVVGEDIEDVQNGTSITGGTVTVSKDGTKTILEFNLTTSAGALTGYYKGTLEQF